jgi:gliding motility-associated-like protein
MVAYRSSLTYMKHKILVALIVLLASGTTVYSQIGVDNIAPQSTFVNDTIVITGSGFSSTMANLEVWFGTVRGTIIASSEFAIEVRVPAQARATNITVINKAANLSAMSEQKFIPALRTEPFSSAKFPQAVSFLPNPANPQNELWDVCVCDLNNDNKPDVASSKFQRPGSSIYRAATDIMLLLNNSVPGTLNNASFTKLDLTAALSGINFPTDNVVCGDLNGDGKPELVVSRATTNTRNSIHILRNTSAAVGGNPTFATQTALFLPNATDIATRISIRDLNNDGKPELIVTNSNSEIFFVFVNQSTNSTSVSFNPTPIALDIDPNVVGNANTYDLEVQDFNNDGWADIVINRFVSNNFYVFKNLKSPTISFAAPVVTTTPTNDVVFNRVTSADFNKDGKLDLIFTNSASANAKISAIYLNTSAGDNITFTPDNAAIKFTASAGAWGVDITDIDGDKDVDFVVATKDVTELNVYLNDGGTTPAFSKQVISTPGWNPRNIKAADMDGDGKPDIIFTGQNDAGQTTALEILQNTLCHQPVIENEDNLKICNGQTIILKAHQAVTTNGVTTFEWKKDGVVVGGTTAFLTITAPGVYRVTNVANSCNLFDEITVTSDPGGAPADPDFTSNSPLCAGTTLNLNGTPTVGGATYTWTKPDGSTLSGQAQSFSVDLEDAGYYSLQIQVGVCKSDVVTKRVDVANMGNFSITANPGTAKICQGNQINLAIGSVPNHTYSWERNGTPTGQATTSINVSDEASYTVVVTNIALSNCSTETTPVVTTVYTSPVASYTAQATACTGVNVAFTNTSTFDNRGTIAYTWNFGDATSSTETSPSTKKYTNAGTFNSTLTANYTDVSGTGCSNTSAPKPITVTATVVPTINSTETSLCPDGTSTLSVSGTFNTITWSNAATGSSTIVTGPATYSVTTVDANNCTGTDDFEIAALPVPAVVATADPTSIKQGETSQLLAEGAVTYSWTPVETLSDPLIANPVASPLETTTYTVVGTNADGCTGTVDLSLEVSGVLGFPVAFSPNNDGINDIWNIGATAPDKADCTLSIFDGKGRRLFEGKGQNWDGTYQNNEAPEGTYYFVFGCPNEKPVTGNVLIIR